MLAICFYFSFVFMSFALSVRDLFSFSQWELIDAFVNINLQLGAMKSWKEKWVKYWEYEKMS